MDLTIMAELPFDKKDPINAGVLSYDYVGPSVGVAMHRVRYQCPVSCKKYNFVTSLPYMSPDLIAFLYKTRWDIEKIFDEVKNKLSEKKSWATSEKAKTMQAQFICLAHNLILIFEKLLEQIGIENVKENDRRRARLDKTLKTKSSSEKRKLPKFLTMPKYATQRALKFIRWLRNHLYIDTPWIVAVDSLKRVYAVFLKNLDTVGPLS